MSKRLHTEMADELALWHEHVRRMFDALRLMIAIYSTGPYDEVEIWNSA